MNGSTRSGPDGTGEGCEDGAAYGPLLNNRMACVMVGWKRPPYFECADRTVGRVLPSSNNLAVDLTDQYVPFEDAS